MNFTLSKNVGFCDIKQSQSRKNEAFLLTRRKAGIIIELVNITKILCFYCWKFATLVE